MAIVDIPAAWKGGGEHGIRRTFRSEPKIAIQLSINFRDATTHRFRDGPGRCGLSIQRGMGGMHRIREWNHSVLLFQRLASLLNSLTFYLILRHKRSFSPFIPNFNMTKAKVPETAPGAFAIKLVEAARIEPAQLKWNILTPWIEFLSANRSIRWRAFELHLCSA